MSYRAGRRIQPAQVRAAAFRSRWRGLDPEEVYDYLGRLADELEHLRRAERVARTEAERFRQAMLHWQSRHYRCWFVDPSRPTPNRGRW
ncbi:DivIVA domain-containing protein [Plantactinospora sp. B6F1]|uniref:DivIVA domain-containing protein n=1 Tax=Plantactinospora sp. B6F1 TaxID=3158971 RepID=UPI0032D90043